MTVDERGQNQRCQHRDLEPGRLPDNFYWEVSEIQIYSPVISTSNALHEPPQHPLVSSHRSSLINHNLLSSLVGSSSKVNDVNGDVILLEFLSESDESLLVCGEGERRAEEDDDSLTLGFVLSVFEGELKLGVEREGREVSMMRLEVKGLS